MSNYHIKKYVIRIFDEDIFIHQIRGLQHFPRMGEQLVFASGRQVKIVNIVHDLSLIDTQEIIISVEDI